MDRCAGRLEIRKCPTADGHVHVRDSRLRGLPLPERVYSGCRSGKEMRRDGVAVWR